MFVILTLYEIEKYGSFIMSTYIFRLRQLQEQMVGGENIANTALKEKHQQRLNFAEERRLHLARLYQIIYLLVYQLLLK